MYNAGDFFAEAKLHHESREQGFKRAIVVHQLLKRQSDSLPLLVRLGLLLESWGCQLQARYLVESNASPRTS